MKIDISTYKYDNYHIYQQGFNLTVKIICDIYKCAFNDLDLSELPLKFGYTSNSPCINKERTCIYLNCNIAHHCQVAYQLCHELCHIAIKGDVPLNIRWFEESICECASLYFLHLVANQWQKQEFNTEYHSCFDDYKENLITEKSKIDKFELSSLCDKESQIAVYLTTHEYDRKKNLYVAIKLLPLFTEYPVLWKVIQNLNKVKNTQTIIDALHELKSISEFNALPAIDLIITTIKADTMIHS